MKGKNIFCGLCSKRFIFYKHRKSSKGNRDSNLLMIKWSSICTSFLIWQINVTSNGSVKLSSLESMLGTRVTGWRLNKCPHSVGNFKGNSLFCKCPSPRQCKMKQQISIKIRQMQHFSMFFMVMHIGFATITNLKQQSQRLFHGGAYKERTWFIKIIYSSNDYF